MFSQSGVLKKKKERKKGRKEENLKTFTFSCRLMVSAMSERRHNRVMGANPFSESGELTMGSIKGLK